MEVYHHIERNTVHVYHIEKEKDNDFIIYIM